MNQANNPFFIPFSKPYLSIEETQLVQEALSSSWISDGPFRERLENEFAALHHVPVAVSVCSGTAALEIVLRNLKLAADNEVIVPGFTFPAPYNLVLALGAKPVYADIDEQTWCMDTDIVESLISPRTRAIIAVHVYGNMCNMQALRKIADRHHLVLIEDCAQAVFSSYQGSYAGTLGDFGCFSFQATKTITTGEGGLVISSKTDVAKQLRLLRNHGMSPEKRYWHDVIGFNYRMTNLQAALGCAQLTKISDIIARKKKILDWYTQRLSNVEGLILQKIDEKVDPVIWSMGVKIDPQVFKASRDQVIQTMLEQGIETRCGFYAPSEMPLYHAPSLPVSETVGRQVIALPAFTELTEAEVDRICELLLRLRGCDGR